MSTEPHLCWEIAGDKVALELLCYTELGSNLHCRNSCGYSKSILVQRRMDITNHQGTFNPSFYFISLYSTTL